MNETINQQDIVESIPSSESLDDIVSVDDVSGNDVVEEIASETTEPVEDVSAGDVQTEVSFPTTENNMPATGTTEFVCTCSEKGLLWESDIASYDITDGLLLLILVFVIVNTAFNVFGKRG